MGKRRAMGNCHQFKTLTATKNLHKIPLRDSHFLLIFTDIGKELGDRLSLRQNPDYQTRRSNKKSFLYSTLTKTQVSGNLP